MLRICAVGAALLNVGAICYSLHTLLSFSEIPLPVIPAMLLMNALNAHCIVVCARIAMRRS
jgi:hypothetical protein